MRFTHAWLMLPIVFGVLALPAPAHGQTAYKSPDNPYPYEENEPKAKVFSPAKGAQYLDGVAQFWMRANSCGACHANFAYVMARPVLDGRSTSLLDETRGFLEKRQPHPQFSFHAHAAAIAFALAWDDAHTSGKLQPTTRQALRRMWDLQGSWGSWDSMGCGRTPPELDPHFAAVLAALAAGVAPEGYARAAEAQDGLTKLRRYFATTSPRHLHDKAMRLWASLHLDGLLTTAERAATVQALLAKQRHDGGWSFVALSGQTTRVTLSGASEPPSDGYGTGFAIYILRQAGMPASRPAIVQGVRWLHSHQRASGRWFTPARVSPTEGGVGSRDLYVQNLGTAFAMLALKACEGTDSRRPLRPTPGLLLRDRLIPD